MSNENENIDIPTDDTHIPNDSNDQDEPQSGVDPEIEAEARESGWVPKDQYKGNPERWVDADEFVERGKAINPILRKNNERLRAEIAAERAELQKLKLTVSEFNKEFLSMKENAYKRALNDLKAQKREAMREGDFEAVESIEEQIDDYKEQAAKVKPVEEVKEVPEPTKISETFKDWHSENKWFHESKEPDMFDTAEGYAIRLRREIREGKVDPLSEEAFLNRVTAHVKKKFPEKFENPNREKGSSVSSGSSRGAGSGGKHSYASLPADAKKACDNYVESKLMTREQYVAAYFEGE